MHSSINYLEWDSMFFDFRVGKVNLLEAAPHELECLLHQARADNYTLVYLFLDTPVNPSVLSNFGQVHLVDEKVTYVQKVNPHVVSWEEGAYPLYEMMKETSISDRLTQLALQSGEYSRFKVDKKISNIKFEELYKLWLKNSLSKQFANEVWIWKESEDILGLITLSAKSNRADIGLISVDSSSRGQGIGKAMVKKALHFTSIRELEILQVVTQKQNIRACQFYKSSGFLEEKVNFVYHLWT